MTKRRGAIIPNPENPTGTYRRVLCIPGSPDWIALVTGALYVLTQEWYWDAQTGDIDAVVARAKQMYFEYQDQSGDCDVPAADVGDIKMRANAVLPDGWLYCNGDEVLKSAYPALWEAIVTAWGTASDPDFFVLPDLRGTFPLGFAVGGGAPALGTYGGEPDVTLTEAEMPVHTHSKADAAGGSGDFSSIASPYQGNDVDAAGWESGTAGGGEAHNNMPPYAAVSFIIYAGL